MTTTMSVAIGKERSGSSRTSVVTVKRTAVGEKSIFVTDVQVLRR
jgi:hypothetical protein